MPDVTNQEFVVTTYVLQNFTGDSYTTRSEDGGTYYRFGSAPNERWVDTDNDGFFDYGLRDEGYGHWSTFDGFQWKDAKGNVKRDSEYDEPNGVGTGRSAFEADGHSSYDFGALPLTGSEDGWIF